MRIGVIGSGYVGLVASACFADSGNDVVCMDQDVSKIEALKKGQIPIFEPGLESLVHRGVSAKRLSFTSSMQTAVAGAELVFLAVGTPAKENGNPNLDSLKAASKEVGRCLTGYSIIVNKSTVPIGAHQWVANWIGAEARHEFDVVSNPEFLKEGTAIEDFLRPDRVIVGTNSETVYKKMVELYAPFLRQGNPVIRMDPISAELTKYACNSFLATRISFINELAGLCDRVGGDIEKVRAGMMGDVRIGRYFLYAGVGYGGSCFPKDIQALLHTGKEKGVELGVIAAADQANERQKKYLAKKIEAHFGSNLAGRVFGIWGLSFKPNTDDMREAPSLTLIDLLLKAGAEVKCFDPVAMENARKILGKNVQFCQSSYEVPERADALVIVTEWNEFRQPDFDRIKNLMKTPVIFDGRNLFDPEQLEKSGFTYYGIGRGQGKETILNLKGRTQEEKSDAHLT